MNKKAHKFAVFGHPIAQSLSPLLHQQFAKACGDNILYEKREIAIDEFEASVIQFFKQGGKGLNITLPFKVRAHEMADVSSDAATVAGAANTLWFNKGKIYADNTDGKGFINDLKSKKIVIRNKKILIWGAGGAVKGILHPILDEKPQQIIICNRTLKKAQPLDKESEFIKVCPMDTMKDQDYDVFINGTSGAQLTALPLSVHQHNATYYDLKYGKLALEGLKWAQKMGFSIILDGSGMLIQQAALSYEIWNNKRPPLEQIVLIN